MSRRGGQLTRVTLRLGLLLGGMVAGWCAYNAITGDAAYAADAPHAVTGNSTANHQRISPSSERRLTGPTQRRKGAARVPSATAGGGTATSTDPSRVSTGSRAGWKAHPDRSTSPPPRHRGGTAAPDHAARPTAGTPGRKGTENAQGRVPAAGAGRPVAKPHPGAAHGRGRAGAGEEQGPGDEPGPNAEPPVSRHIPPTRNGAKNAAETPVPGPKARPIDANRVVRPAPRLAPAVRVIVGLLTVPQRHVKAGEWSPPKAEPATTRGPADPTTVAIVQGNVPGPGAEPAPDAPAPRPASVGVSNAGHCDTTDAPTAVWMPPAVPAQRYRPDRAGGGLPSRSPRPGTRPA